jgi:uncharacterized protein
MVRVVLDTNILISGLLYLGKPKRLIDLAIVGKIEVVSSYEMIDEFIRVISRDKFKLSTGDQEEFINFVIRLSKITVVRSSFKVVEEDPDDDMVINTAYDGNAAYIVSGNRHLYEMREFSGIRILKASEMLTLLEA